MRSIGRFGSCSGDGVIGRMAVASGRRFSGGISRRSDAAACWCGRERWDARAVSGYSRVPRTRSPENAVCGLSVYLSLFPTGRMQSKMKNWDMGRAWKGLCGAAVLLAVLGLGSNALAAGHGGGGHGGGGGGHHGGGGGGHHGGGGGGGHHHHYHGGGSSFGIGIGVGYGGFGYPGFGYSSFGYPGFGSPFYGYGGYPGYGYSGYRGYYARRPVYVYPPAPRYTSPRRTVGRVYVTPAPGAYVASGGYVAAPVRQAQPSAYRAEVNAQGEPVGELRPGMVLPDGAVVVSVGE